GFYNYKIVRKFDSSTVWIARYYPYPYSRLKDLISKIYKDPYVKIDTIGLTPQGRNMFMVTITNPKTDDKNKKRIWLHARTHPSETPGSFAVEGLINYLLSECNKCCGNVDLKKLIFNIVPMVNIDGVAEGNARVTPDSSFDLERMWHRSQKNQFELADSAALEVKNIHGAIKKLIGSGIPFIAALNLHSKNAPHDWRPFIYSNFRRTLEAHGSEGDSLFLRHLSFAKIISSYYCGDTVFVRQSYDPALPMQKKPFPESWWWTNFKDSVLAATIELTTGYNGCYEEWVSWRDHIQFGEALAEALQIYYNFYIEKTWYRYDAPCTDLRELYKFFKGEDLDKNLQ
ncbi:MAG: Peptidase protein, partial [Bacteroidota bacterium]|nr:Peptidase protein [Bacteroidota bacterium]